jgi:putative transposase
MPDTEENQEVFPQLSRQKRGLGFPIVRMVVLLSLATAMVEGMEMAPYSGKQTGELALLRELLDQFNPGDVALCDKLYCSYFMLALLLDHKVDVVTLLHQARKVDTRQGKRLGRGDHLITFQRPSRPTWMTPETYAQIPKKIELRMIRVRINERGFRTESLTIITTLTDAKQYSRDEIAELYRRRWLAELDIRAIKSTMGMDHLRCKTPDMVRKEIWTCLLAYNLIRLKILQSAMKKDISPRNVSFTGTLQILAAGWMTMQLMDKQTQHVLVELMLESIASQKVGKRPGRTDPRAVKRRPKPYRLLTMPRQEAHALLLAGINPYQKKK